MEDPNNSNPKNILKIDDSEYLIDSLPDEAKEIIAGLRTADVQIQMHQDTLKLLTFSKGKLVEDLKKILDYIEPINP